MIEALIQLVVVVGVLMLLTPIVDKKFGHRALGIAWYTGLTIFLTYLEAWPWVIVGVLMILNQVEVRDLMNQIDRLKERKDFILEMRNNGGKYDGQE